MTYDEYKVLWASLDEAQKESARLKARWEHMTLWAVCNAYPGIWNDPQRLAVIRGSPAHAVCRTCEWWDAGGEKAKPVALIGDCLNRLSDRFTPEWDHVCKEWMAEK